MRAADRPRVLGDRPSAPSRLGGLGSQVRRDHVCELVVLDCGPGHNFELELSERRIAADLAGQLHPFKHPAPVPVTGHEVAVDLMLLARIAAMWWVGSARVGLDHADS